MSVEEDELRRRVSILEAKIRKLEERNGLLAAILTLAFVTVFIGLAAVFLTSFSGLVPTDSSVALVVISVFLILLFILGRRTIESSVRKSAEALDEQT